MKNIKKENVNKNDIRIFLIEQRVYVLYLLLIFYIVSRIITIFSVILNYNEVKIEEFYMKIIFHSINLIILFLGIRKDKYS